MSLLDAQLSHCIGLNDLCDCLRLHSGPLSTIRGAAPPSRIQWISASIGLHHVHHLRPRIPNYNLQRCLNEIPELQLPNPLTLGNSLRSVRLKLWDEKRKLLLSFREMTLQMRQSRPTG